MGNQRFIASIKKVRISQSSSGVDVSALNWHELRSLASEKGVKVFGRGRAVIEKDLQEVLSRE